MNNIKLWICITIILQNFKNEFNIFENQEERQMCSETILKIIDNSSNFSLFYKSLSDGELDHINKLSTILNCKSVLSEFIDYFDIVHSMQQWLLSLPKYTWVISRYYIEKNKYTDIDSKFLKFRDILKIFPLNPVQTIKFKISEIFGTTNFADLLKNIKNAKEYFESLVLALKDNILNDLNYIFDGDFKKWLRELSNEKKKFLTVNF